MAAASCDYKLHDPLLCHFYLFNFSIPNYQFFILNDLGWNHWYSFSPLTRSWWIHMWNSLCFKPTIIIFIFALRKGGHTPPKNKKLGDRNDRVGNTEGREGSPRLLSNLGCEVWNNKISLTSALLSQQPKITIAILILMSSLLKISRQLRSNVENGKKKYKLSALT